MWFRPRWDEVWFPDAFVGTMAQLLVAVENGTEPEIGGRDNLETVALCEAVFAAATEHRVTTVRGVSSHLMIPPLTISQTYITRSRSGPEVFARSDGFPVEWRNGRSRSQSTSAPGPRG